MPIRKRRSNGPLATVPGILAPTGAIGRERDALAVTFRRAVVLALAAQLACGTSSAPDATATDGGGPGDPADASTGTQTAADGGRDASADARCDETPFTPTPPDSCGDYVRLPCGLPTGVVPRANCYLNLVDCASICPDIHFNCHATEAYCPDGGMTVVPDEAGAVIIDCATCLGSAGRVPAGLEPATFAGSRSALGAHFARAAHLEAASVHAFRALRAELVSLGAPQELVDAARDAERDEVRHARAVGRLARRFGGRVMRARVRPVPARSVEAIALDNAVEGCIRETYGALLASWQAENVRDPGIAETLGAIAEDELRHAALSWAVARFLDGLLEPAARARVDAARRNAVQELASASAPSALAAAVGLPDARTRGVLVAELTRALWRTAA